jgi:hypothetical protein
MNYQKVVARGRSLLKRSEEEQWALAKLTAEVLGSGVPTRKWAEDIGIDHSHAASLRGTWEKFGSARVRRRATRAFGEYYGMARSSEERAESKKEAERTGKTIATLDRNGTEAGRQARAALADPKTVALLNFGGEA